MAHKSNNVKTGPTVGNAGNAAKRGAFEAAKSTSSSEKSKLAAMVMSALESRGKGMKPHINKSTEPLKADVNVGKGPRKG